MLTASNVKVYTVTSSASCRKAIQFFNDNNIDMEEIRLDNAGMTKLTAADVILFAKLAGGFNRILAHRSQAYKKELAPLMGLEKTTTNEIINYIIDNPRVLKMPIITDGRKIEFGYHEDEVRTFLPRALKRQIFIENLKSAHSMLIDAV